MGRPAKYQGNRGDDDAAGRQGVDDGGSDGVHPAWSFQAVAVGAGGPVAVVVKKVVKKKRLTRLEVEIIDSDWWWPRCGCDG